MWVFERRTLRYERNILPCFVSSACWRTSHLWPVFNLKPFNQFSCLWTRIQLRKAFFQGSLLEQVSLTPRKFNIALSDTFIFSFILTTAKLLKRIGSSFAFFISCVRTPFSLRHNPGARPRLRPANPAGIAPYSCLWLLVKVTNPLFLNIVNVLTISGLCICLFKANALYTM